MIRLSDVRQVLDAYIVGDDCEFDQLSTDSRNLIKGGLFVALRGENFDGHEFVSSAAQQGVCAVVVDSEQPNLGVPQLVVKNTLVALAGIASIKRSLFAGKVIAVTGSSGKTTVKGMLHSILSTQANALATLGNFNNQIGVPLTLMRLSNEEYAVVELGTSHPGEIEYLTQLIAPDVALVTNVMSAHIGGFGSLNAIAKEKSEVYFSSNAGKAVINMDDSYGKYFIGRAEGKDCIAYALQKLNTETIPIVYARNITYNDQGYATFEICFNEEHVSLTLAVPGLHNVSNALAASACAIACGMNLQSVVDGLSLFKNEKGRMNLWLGVNGSRIIDDTYNANPGSVQAAIDSLSLYSGRKILVLGDMGELGVDAEQCHRDIGLYASQKQVNSVYTCGSLSSLTAESFGENGFAFNNKSILANTLKKELNKNTTILVKGSRSAKMEELVEMLSSKGEVSAC